MKRRDFIGNTIAIGGLTSVIPISQLYSNVQKKLSHQNKKTNYKILKQNMDAINPVFKI